MMKVNFETLKKIIAICENQEGMDAAVNAWQIDMNDNFVSELIDRVGELDIEHIPYALESLLKSNDKIKNMIFCIIFEMTCEDLPFVTNLENIPMFQAKFQFIYNTLSKVFENCYNGIGDCAALMILKADPKLELATDEVRERVVQTVEDRLMLINKYIKENGCKDESLINSLAVTFDLSTYINNDDIIGAIRMFRGLEVAPESKMFMLKTMAYNKIDGVAELVRSLVSYDASRLYRVLESVGCTHLLANTNMTQDMIAYYEMRNWLLYPTECGNTLKALEPVDRMVYKDHLYFIFKFTSFVMTDKGYMIGVAGGYATSGLSDNQTGHTFSKFEPIRSNYKQQAIELIEFIADVWRKKAEEMANGQ